jgi:hypothetical protein
MPLAQLVCLKITLHPETCIILATVLRESQVLERLGIDIHMHSADDLNMLDRCSTRRLQSVEIAQSAPHWQSDVIARLISFIMAPRALKFQHYEVRPTRNIMKKLGRFGWGSALRVLDIEFYWFFDAEQVAQVMNVCPHLDELHLKLAEVHQNGVVGLEVGAVQMLGRCDESWRLHTLSLHVPEEASFPYIDRLNELVAVHAASAVMPSRPIVSATFTLRVTPCEILVAEVTKKQIWRSMQTTWEHSRSCNSGITYAYDEFVLEVYHPYKEYV